MLDGPVVCRPAVFLDRDGVLIEDVPLLTRPEQVRLAEGAAWSVTRLADAGYLVVVASNQPVLARGLSTELDVAAVDDWIQQLLVGAGGRRVDAFYICPHHPNATLAQYRLQCDCRKPRPGLLLQAARDLHIAIGDSFIIGDRVTDIVAGQRAGCATILVQSGRHLDALIETPDSVAGARPADHVCVTLPEAVEWILKRIPKWTAGGRE
jgi:D-glycero-D-manno-heptose 1,7-bisphosphate phosphatase